MDCGLIKHNDYIIRKLIDLAKLETDMTEQNKEFNLNNELKALAFTTEDESGYVSFERVRRPLFGMKNGNEEDRDEIRVVVKSIGNNEATLSKNDYDKLNEGMHTASNLSRYDRYKFGAEETKFMLEMFHDVTVD